MLLTQNTIHKTVFEGCIFLRRSVSTGLHHGANFWTPYLQFWDIATEKKTESRTYTAPTQKHNWPRRLIGVLSLSLSVALLLAAPVHSVSWPDVVKGD